MLLWILNAGSSLITTISVVYLAVSTYESVRKTPELERITRNADLVERERINLEVEQKNHLIKLDSPYNLFIDIDIENQGFLKESELILDIHHDYDSSKMIENSFMNTMQKGPSSQSDLSCAHEIPKIIKSIGWMFSGFFLNYRQI